MPWLTDQYLYLLAPKTASTFVSGVLRVECDGRPLRGQHDPHFQIRKGERGGRAILATYRNPWDWYVSWYCHGMQNDDTQRAGIRSWGGGSEAFRDVLYGVTHPAERRYPALPIAFGVFFRQGCGDTEQSRIREDFATSRVGLCSWTLDYTYGDATDIALDATQATAALSELLGRPIAHAPENTRFQKAGRFQGVPRRAAAWYDDEMIGWVAEADAGLIARFEYEPFKPSPKAVWQ